MMESKHFRVIMKFEFLAYVPEIRLLRLRAHALLSKSQLFVAIHFNPIPSMSLKVNIFKLDNVALFYSSDFRFDSFNYRRIFYHHNLGSSKALRYGSGNSILAYLKPFLQLYKFRSKSLLDECSWS